MENDKAAGRRIAGKRAKEWGKTFETVFHASCLRKGIAISRMPDGCKQIGPGRIIRVKTDFDWVVTYNGQAGLFDTKTNESNTLGNSEIDRHQAQALFKHQMAGAVAGYILWLRNKNRVCFIPAKSLMELIGRRGSSDNESSYAVDIGPLESMDVRSIFEHMKNRTQIIQPITSGPMQ